VSSRRTGASRHRPLWEFLRGGDVLIATGLPSRLAYLDAQGGFHVVQATSGEKGLFHPLASGRLDRGQPLTITILDRDQPVASLTLLDWSSQASTELSPTAGWGLPQNAIEFSLSEICG
jgi:hypothetical protein